MHWFPTSTVGHYYMTKTKPFWRFVKSKQNEHIGVAPIQNDERKLAENSKEKAELLNRQFQLLSIWDDSYEIYEIVGPDYP